jgi:hypothetical protein
MNPEQPTFFFFFEKEKQSWGIHNHDFKNLL